MLQLSYHTLHVFTSHETDALIEHKAHDTQIDKDFQHCELCAKLLGQTLFLWVCLPVLIAFTVFALTINVGELVFIPGPRVIRLLRGPPSPFV